MDISQRDRNAVEYTKNSALLDGDTLVVIKYPNGQLAYDPNGFPLNEIHRVHSDKLLATGSAVFKKKLEDLWLNHRAAKMAGVFPTLPGGIKYVVDLTPPEEGDDALQLTADLCCSPGIINWYTAQSRLGVSRTLVAGLDETTVRKDPISHPTSPTKTTAKPITINGNAEPPVSELSTAVTSIFNGETSGLQYRRVIPDKKPNDHNHLTVPFNSSLRAFGQVPDSWTEDDGAVSSPPPNDETLNSDGDAGVPDKPVLDYCPIRHRAGIERLLQIVEGKQPRLDSAPKIWTLAVLSKYFDCESAVADYVTTWILAEPNCRFMEILPEATLKLGLTIQSHTLTRAGFSILVSEEALCVGGGKYFQNIQHKNKHTNPYAKGATRFGRAAEDLDEDVFNLIQHAGRNFSARIEKQLGELIDRDVKWLKGMPEFTKLLAFQDHINAFSTSEHAPPGLKSAQQNVDSLIDLICDFVRGKIIFCLIDNLSYQQAKDGTNHRIAERWQSLDAHGGAASFVHDFIYNTLSDHERMMTRGFWEKLRAVEWDHSQYSNRLCDDLPEENPYYKQNDKISEAYGIQYVNTRYLENRTRDFNAAYRVLNGTFNSGREISADVPSMFPPAVSTQSNVESSTEHLEIEDENKNETLDDWYEAERAVEAGSGVHDSHWSVRDMRNWFPDSIFNEGFDKIPRFSLPTFFMQVQKHIRSLCTTMLAKGDNDWSILCPTLLCLGDEEFKFLPLWAGGMDDGSGGVFEQEIPPAEKGPIGPGPSFHTGSTANSAASDFEFDGSISTFDSDTMEGIKSSLGVEDGFSSHLDRRMVYSEEDFPMQHDALPVRTVGDRSGAMAAEGSQTNEGHSSSATGTLAIGSVQEVTTNPIDQDNFFDNQDDEQADWEMEDSDSEGTVTEE